MKGCEITTEEVADKIADLILGQTYISKAQLAPKINAYLKAFVKIQSIPKLFPRDLKMTEILKQKTHCAMATATSDYYASELCKLVGKEGIKKYNDYAQAIKDAHSGNPMELINHAIYMGNSILSNKYLK